MPSPRTRLAYRLGLALAALLASGSSSFALGPDVNVSIDEASMLKLQRPAAEIIIGNPSIADVSVQSGKVLVVTGKSYGETNLIVLDAEGKAIINRKVSVKEPQRGLVTVHKGAQRFSYYCAPDCTSQLAIGDNADYFDTISKQIKGKQGLGQSSAEGSSFKE